MNTKHYSTKWLATRTAVSALIVTLGLLQASLAQETRPTTKARVGIYDSRAVAVAFAGSAAFNKWLGDLKAEHAKAKASGDQKRVAELEAEGAARQRLLHLQGFSTAPVTNLLDQIKDKLPAINKKARVSVLVSKWDKDVLARYKDADLVDVTMALVDAFSPSERQRKSAIGIQEHKPISLEQAERIKD
jgi:hypothetical protein